MLLVRQRAPHVGFRLGQLLLHSGPATTGIDVEAGRDSTDAEIESAGNRTISAGARRTKEKLTGRKVSATSSVISRPPRTGTAIGAMTSAPKLVAHNIGVSARVATPSVSS